jgi:hypothetical protein
LAASAAMASLSSDIQSMGMCKAVCSAVANGATVSSIVAQSGAMTPADQQTLLTALYAAGASDDAIRISAEKAKISDLTLIDAFNANSKQGCVDNVAPAASPVVAGVTQAASPAVADVTQAASPVVADAAQAASPAAARSAAIGLAQAVQKGSAVASEATETTIIPVTATSGAGASTASLATPATARAASPAQAEFAPWNGPRPALLGEYWDTFYKNYKTRGIDQATILAITEGVQPAALVQGGLALDDLNPQNLIKAMYCAGYNGDDIKRACDQFKVSDLVLISGFQKSKAECTQDCRDHDHMADTQAYTPAETPPSDPPPGPPSPPSPPSPPVVSPAAFSINP